MDAPWARQAATPRPVTPRQASGGRTVRTVLDALVVAAEPVGRAAPGVALVRLLRCTDGPLDVEQVTRIGGDADRVRWTSLGRIVLGRLAGRKVTADGGELVVHDDQVRARVRASTRQWTALTIAVDGHQAGDAQTCRALLDRQASRVVDRP